MGESSNKEVGYTEQFRLREGNVELRGGGCDPGGGISALTMLGIDRGH